MSVERSFEAWEEVQRHGHDLADRLAQGFTGLIQSHITPPSFQWPNPQKPKLFDVEFPSQSFVNQDFGFAVENSGINGVSAILDIGNRLGQVGADFGACLNGVVQQFFRRLPMPFRQDEGVPASVQVGGSGQQADLGVALQEDFRLATERLREFGFAEDEGTFDGLVEEEIPGFDLSSAGLFGMPKVNFETGYVFLYFCL